jgi:hypothetical protein
MRATLRLLLCLLLSGSLGFAAIPRQPPVPELEKTDCCAKMTAESINHECEHQTPKSDPDKQSCAACALCLSGVIAAATPFVYPSVGDETFAAYVSSGHFRSQQPPVPPPRA